MTSAKQFFKFLTQNRCENELIIEPCFFHCRPFTNCAWRTWHWQVLRTQISTGWSLKSSHPSQLRSG